MGSMENTPSTLIEMVEAILNVDVDSIDPRVSTALPFKAHNQTSNQVIACNTMLLPEYRDLFLSNVRKFGKQGWLEVFNRITVEFCKNNIENITGRVLVQVSPARVYDTQQVLDQCYAYDRAFADVGISRDRYAIKISTTGPAMVAAKKLNAEGIRTLGTSLFSLPQAVAASQAGCVFISPYFNEVAAYSDDSLMHKGTDPAITHPMAPRIVQILDAYTKLYAETGKDQPLIVMASNANLGEIIANAELGCQHITILAAHLEELTKTPLDSVALEKYPFLKNPPPKKQTPYYKSLTTPSRLKGHLAIDPLAGPGWDGKLPDIHTDYLADGGKPLTAYIDSDAAVVRKMKDVLTAFGDAEVQAKAAIEKEIAAL